MLAEVIRTNCQEEKNSKAYATNIIQVTFKDLQKLVQSQSSLEQNQLGTRLKDKPFWIWDQRQHKQEDIKTKGDC
jgi:hypothetical protein